MLGLFQFPSNLLNRTSKFQPCLRQLYKWFVIFYLGIIVILSYFCVLFKSSKEFIEFFSTFTELGGATLICIEIIILNLKRRELFELLSRMNKFDLKSNKSVAFCRRLERIFFFMINGNLIFVIILKFAEPFFPISYKSAQDIQSIYGLKYPQNRLPICLWLPFIDTSEPVCFYILYSIELYYGLLTFVLSTNAALFYPLIMFHLIGQHFVLAGQLKALGKTQLRKDSRVRPKPSNQERQRLKRLHDVLEMKECIVFHQKLLEFRVLYDHISQDTTTLRVVFLLLMTSISSYIISVLSEFDNKKGSLIIIIEFIFTLSFFYIICIMSEIFEWANCHIRRSIYQSQWYRMAPEAQRMMLMFLRRTQRPHYVRILYGMVVLGNEVFLRTLKMVFSFVQCVKIVRK
ncbi:hypothetical protein WDU94_011197 [Cyamophila willieti]